MTGWVTAGAQRVLTAVGAYALAVAGLVVWATALRSGPAPVPRWSVGLALLVVAVTLPVVCRWVDPAVYDLVHGQDDGVGEVLAGLGQGIEASAEPASVLEAMAASAVRLLRVPSIGVDIWPVPHDPPGESLEPGWDAGLSAHRGTPVIGAEEMIVPADYRGEAVGQLRVGGRRARQVLSADDRRLAADVARYRDLHDGLGPTLASLKLQLAALRRTMEGGGGGGAQHRPPRRGRYVSRPPRPEPGSGGADRERRRHRPACRRRALGPRATDHAGADRRAGRPTPRQPAVGERHDRHRHRTPGPATASGTT